MLASQTIFRELELYYYDLHCSTYVRVYNLQHMYLARWFLFEALLGILYSNSICYKFNLLILFGYHASFTFGWCLNFLFMWMCSFYMEFWLRLLCSSLPKEDIQPILECGCPNLFPEAVNSAKRLQAFLRVDEGDVSLSTYL